MNLKDFENKLGYHFKNKDLLKESLTHKSLQKSTHNERLEFLGDAVLDLIVGEFLFKKFPHFSEGELSKMRASMVNEKAFAKVARFLEIGKYLYISPSEEQNKGRDKDSILSNAFEAIIGAIYLESDLETTQNLFYSLIPQVYENIDPKSLFSDYKTALQELSQSLFGVTPQYIVLDCRGPDHNKEFFVGISILDKEYATASGKSKKEAQQNAAKIALNILKENDKQGKQ